MRKTPGVDMTSGSLGHGLSAGVGLALDARVRGSASRTFVILGDGELQEGLVWEGAMAAAKYGARHARGVRRLQRTAEQRTRRRDHADRAARGQSGARSAGRSETVDGHDMGEILTAVAAAGSSGAADRRARPHHQGQGRRLHGGRQPLAPGVSASAKATVDRPASAEATVSKPACAPEIASCRAAFGDTVLELFREGRPVMAVTSDTRSSMGLDAFAREAPEHHVEVGIAEQNLMTVAAGLAASRPDGLRRDLCDVREHAGGRADSDVPRLSAAERQSSWPGLGGLTGGIEGVAHLALEDLGMLRCIPDLVILNPADAIETRQLVRAAADHHGPVYIRLGRDDSPVVCGAAIALAIGPGRILAEHGWDAALLTSGLITAEVLTRRRRSGDDGIACAVVEFPTLKPIDHDLILRAAGRAQHLFTIEEHSIVGGLGSAVCDVLAGAAPAIVNRIGINDVFLESGSPPELRAKYGLTADAIAARVREVAAPCRRVHTGPRMTYDHPITSAANAMTVVPTKRHRRQQHEHRRRRPAEVGQLRVLDWRDHQHRQDDRHRQQRDCELSGRQARRGVQEHGNDAHEGEEHGAESRQAGAPRQR